MRFLERHFRSTSRCNQGHSDDHDDILLCDYAGCFRWVKASPARLRSDANGALHDLSHTLLTVDLYPRCMRGRDVV